jgi:hypothetical protein
MNRALIILAIGGAVFGGIYGLAASLSVSSESLGAGNTTVASCQQTGAVAVSYTGTGYSASVPAYQVTQVTVGSIDLDNCSGKTIKVTLTGGSNASLGEQTDTVPTGTGSAGSRAFTFTGVSAAAVTGVHVLITG